MTRYYKKCETCTEDMQRAYCNYCEKSLVEVTDEVSQREMQASEMKALLEEIVAWDERFKHYPQSFIVKAKALLARIAKDESMKG